MADRDLRALERRYQQGGDPRDLDLLERLDRAGASAVVARHRRGARAALLEVLLLRHLSVRIPRCVAASIPGVPSAVHVNGLRLDRAGGDYRLDQGRIVFLRGTRPWVGDRLVIQWNANFAGTVLPSSGYYEATAIRRADRWEWG